MRSSTIPRFGMINIHASLLPKYRGAAPIHRAVIDGERETGVTIMRVVTELDAGPMFATARRAIGPDETTPEVERALAGSGASLVLRVIEQIATVARSRRRRITRRRLTRPRSSGTKGRSTGRLPAERIHNLVRGLQPWPLVTVTLNGVRCRIHRSALTDETTDAGPGTITSTSGGVIAIAAGDGRLLRILDIQPEGKRVMPVRDFLSGHPVAAGASLA